MRYPFVMLAALLMITPALAQSVNVGGGMAGLKVAKVPQPDVFVASLGDPEMSAGLTATYWGEVSLGSVGAGYLSVGDITSTWRTRLQEKVHLLGKDFDADSDLTITAVTKFHEGSLLLGIPSGPYFVSPGLLVQHWAVSVNIMGAREGVEPVVANWERVSSSYQVALAARLPGIGWVADGLISTSVAGLPGYSAEFMVTLQWPGVPVTGSAGYLYRSVSHEMGRTTIQGPIIGLGTSF